MKTKVLTILASAVVAFGLWFYVISVEHTQTDRVIRDVEVTMVGEETLERLGLMITSDMDKKVDLTLVGNRRVLGSLKKSDIEVSVDLTEFYLPGEKKIKYEVNFHGIKNGEIEVVSIKADTEMLLIEEWATKEIPVEIRPEADAVGEAFEILNKETNHTTVTIRGPKVVVDQIHLAALFINKDDIQKNMRPNSDIVVVQKVYTLCNQDGNPVTDVSDIETNRGEIRATMQVSKIKEVNFGYMVKPGGGLKGDANDVRITLDYTTITLGGSQVDIDALQNISLGTIDLSDPKIVSGQPFVVPLNIPASLTNISGITEVTVTVEFLKETKVKTFDIPKAQFVGQNAPEGLNPNYKTEKITVTLRGLAEDLDKVKKEDIALIVDLSALQQGASWVNCPATVQIGGELQVGAMGTYVVNAMVIQG